MRSGRLQLSMDRLNFFLCAQRQVKQAIKTKIAYDSLQENSEGRLLGQTPNCFKES
jgi:hypothetical protein